MIIFTGNEYLHHLTNGEHEYDLRVDLLDHHGNTAYAQYDNFSIDSEDNLYTLNVGHYSGDAGMCFIF